MKRLIPVSLFIMVIFFVKCSKDKWEGKIYKEQGVTVIESEGAGIWGDKINKKIKFKDNLSLGAEKGLEHATFHSELDIAVDSELDIYVLDIRNHRLLKFNKEGNFIWEKGRKGQGPGEFQNPFKIEISPLNEIYILDWFTCIHLFNEQGSYKHTINLRRSFRDFQFLPDGRLFLNTSIQGETGIAAEFYSSEGEFLKKFPVEYRYGPEISGGGYVGGEFRFLKDKIYMVFPDKYEIREYDIKGKLIRKIKRDFKFKPPEVKRLERGFFISKRTTLGPCFMYEKKILINELFHIEGESEKDLEINIFLDFFNEKGQFLGSYKLPEWTKLITIDSNNNFYFVELDPFPRVIRSTLSID